MLSDRAKQIADQVMSANDLPETDPLDIADLIMDAVMQEIGIDEDTEAELSNYVQTLVKEYLS